MKAMAKSNPKVADGGFPVIAENKVSFKESLAAVRKERGYTVAEIIKIIRHPTRTVERWISGQCVPRAAVRDSTLHALNDPRNTPSLRHQEEMKRLHHLTWDKTKQTWKLKIRIDMGKKIVGKLLNIGMKTTDEAVAIQKRDAIIDGYRKLGLTVTFRKTKREGRS